MGFFSKIWKGVKKVVKKKFNIKVTRLAHGVPIGGELDFLDDGTIAQALKARNILQ